MNEIFTVSKRFCQNIIDVGDCDGGGNWEMCVDSDEGNDVLSDVDDDFIILDVPLVREGSVDIRSTEVRNSSVVVVSCVCWGTDTEIVVDTSDETLEEGFDNFIFAFLTSFVADFSALDAFSTGYIYRIMICIFFFLLFFVFSLLSYHYWSKIHVTCWCLLSETRMSDLFQFFF